MKTALDWSAYQDAGMGDAYADIPRHGGDFAKAVAVCINSRQCEAETRKGVMCPSFRVTGDPALSTGGRVRLLKAALNTGSADAHPADAVQPEASLLDAALADPTLARAMDLCVACKGCKRECESNVDMALIKSEYLAQRVRRDGLRWRARLFAALPHWLSRYRPTVRWLIGMRNRHPWLAQLGQWLLGITAEAPLPEPTRAPFEADPEPVAAPASALAEAAPPSLPEVVLLVDCFGRHFEPEIPRAALRVLRAAGCCGMAGTFGLEQEHADLSRQMAELALLPQLRANPSAPVIANGFSCRQQIRAHALQRPRHLAQVLADALEL